MGTKEVQRRVRSSWLIRAVTAFTLGSVLTAGLMRAAHKSPPEPQVAAPNRPIAAAMPPGHPTVNMPAGHPKMSGGTAGNDAVVVKAQKQAEQNPASIQVWNRYGDIAMRFAMFNPADYHKAREAFAHVLQIDPDNRDALRGIGDVYFDLRQYPNAIDAYRRYLRTNPDDSRVLTDLGTMYLSQHDSSEAIKEYRMALVRKPDFFPAEFNLAVAYLFLKDNSSARDALVKARTIAPDGTCRTRIDEMLARMDERTAMADTKRGTNQPH